MALIKPEQLRSGSYTISGSFSGSFQGDGSGLINLPPSTIDTGSLVTTSLFNSFTSSYIQDSSSFDTRILNNNSSIDLLSGSFIGFSGSYLIDSSSFDTRISNNSSSIDLLSGSFDSFTQTYNTGSFTGSFTGSLFGTASWAINAQTASYVLPLNQDVLINGSLNITSSFTASGLIYPLADNGEESFIQTDGNGNLSLQYVKTIYEEIVNGESTQLIKGTPVYVSGSQGAASIVYRADAGDPTKMPVIYITADTLSPSETGRGIALGLIKGVDTTGYPAGTEIYIALGGGWTSIRPTGSAIVQTLGYVTKEGTGGQGVILNPGPSNLPNITSGNIWVGDSNSYPITTPTSSLSVASSSISINAETASFAPNYTLTSSFNTFTSSYNTGSFTGSFTGSLFGTSSQSISSSFSETSSFAPNYLPLSGGTVNGNIILTGSLQVSGSISSSSITGSLQGTASFALSSSQAISSSFSSTASFVPGYVSGSGVAGQISFWTGLNSQGGDNNLFWDNANKRMGISTNSPLSRLQIRGIGTTTSTTTFRLENSSGVASLQVRDDSTLQHTTISLTSISTNTIAFQFPASIGETFKMMYTVKDGSNLRGGEYLCVQNGTNVNTIHSFPLEFGSTSGINFGFSIVGGTIRITALRTSGTWDIKLNIKIL